MEKALCVKSVMKKIMTDQRGLKKSPEWQKNITGQTIETSLDELSKHQQMDTRTIENMRLSLLAVEVYERSQYKLILLSNIKCSAKVVM